MLPSLHNLGKLNLGDGSQDAATGATPSGENPIEQDFDVQEEYDLDAYYLVRETLRSYRPASVMTSAQVYEKFGFQHSAAKDAAFEQLERARLATHLDPREAPTVHSVASGVPSQRARVNTIRNMMAVGKPMGGYEAFYESTMARCVGLCMTPDGAGPYDAMRGAPDCAVVYWAMPIAPLQKPYTMSDAFDAAPSGPGSAHPWSKTCQVRRPSQPGGLFAASPTDDPDVRITLARVRANESASNASSGSNNLGRSSGVVEYEFDAGAFDCMRFQFDSMGIMGRKSYSDAYVPVASTGAFIWDTMATQTGFFTRSSIDPQSLTDVTAEAYNTLLAAVMGLTPPIYQLIILPFALDPYGPDGAEEIKNMYDWWTVSRDPDGRGDTNFWKLIVVSEAAFPGDRDRPYIEDFNPMPPGKARFANATHHYHIDKEHVRFEARRSMSLQTRLAEFGFLMNDNKVGNCVVQKPYLTQHGAFEILQSNKHQAIADRLQMAGDVLAIDFDLQFTFHVETMTEYKGTSAAAWLPVYGAVGGDMYTRPSPPGAMIIDAACIRFVNLMVYCMNTLCSGKTEDQERHKELTYMLAAMTRFTSVDAHNKTALCQYFFHVKDPAMLQQGYLEHEVHSDALTYGGAINGDTPGPGYSLRDHPDDEGQIGPGFWQGDEELYRNFMSQMYNVWDNIGAWTYTAADWAHFWKKAVSNVRERVSWYGMRGLNENLGGSGCKYGKLRIAGRKNVRQFLLHTLGGGGNWKASAQLQPDTRPGVGAVLSFPLVVLALVARGAKLFESNEIENLVADDAFAHRPDEWPVVPIRRPRRQQP
jgi:hypothetical protein